MITENYLYKKEVDLFEEKYGKLVFCVDDENAYKEFHDRRNSAEWGKQIYGEWAKKYEKIMLLAKDVLQGSSFISKPVECYCGNTYKEINKYMRSGIDNENDTYREMSNILSIILCSAPIIPDNIIVYRIVCNKFIDELINQNKKEQPTPVQEKGFMSTSLLKTITTVKEGYAKQKNLLKIYIEKNTIGLYVNEVTSRSEEELLLLPNGLLALIKYPYKDRNSDKMIYECKLINY